jgi:hypothetical protein
VSEEEDLILWQEVLDEVASGRSGKLEGNLGVRCPFCKKGTIHGEKMFESRGSGGAMKLYCPEPSCKKFIEGSFGPEDV